MMSNISNMAAMPMATSLALMRSPGVPWIPVAVMTRSSKVGGGAGITGRWLGRGGTLPVGGTLGAGGGALGEPGGGADGADWGGTPGGSDRGPVPVVAAASGGLAAGGWSSPCATGPGGGTEPGGRATPG